MQDLCHSATQVMIDDLPICDIHVHLPGTISPLTAWKLGIKNKLFDIVEKNNKHTAVPHPKKLSEKDPHNDYLEIFKDNFIIDKNKQPRNLNYNINKEGKFKSFDRVMATVQGHRHPPGGIQDEKDLNFVMQCFLQDCLDQNIVYVELQQNIKIAYLLYPKIEKKQARLKLFDLLQEISDLFMSKNVILKFLHCFNKTTASGETLTTHERTLEAAQWLAEAKEHTPDLFLGLESAGHEKDQSGWPKYLKAGYEKVKKIGLGCEAHGGEGIGVEHMMDVVRTLPITRVAHGFQVIEDLDAIEEVKKRNITLIMTPLLNFNLGICLHVNEDNNNIIPMKKTLGGKKRYLSQLHEHPIFELFRDYKMKITLGSDNPNLGGEPLKKVIKVLAGLDKDFIYSSEFKPLNAEEIAILALNGVEAIFSPKLTKEKIKNKIISWVKKHNLNESYIINYYS